VFSACLKLAIEFPRRYSKTKRKNILLRVLARNLGPFIRIAKNGQ
jgi:hypothetical protein